MNSRKLKKIAPFGICLLGELDMCTLVLAKILGSAHCAHPVAVDDHHKICTMGCVYELILITSD